ncbi:MULTISPECIES: XdhC/CoxI family protein [Acidithrix]|uniref:Putative xanthine dehydrogenase subunit A n=1 Tax=Acidithrix ferrooxidans TaxID=1280514 RepID=A0A0D8HIE1_9ACTN|nr:MULTISPECIES: XdhC/CoxI family protein [Acidithrix]KJF17698.1 putative xanthine dehydrogenase subunit A [Acidithrix ferrooxidans]CAG4924464.1 unnamed protein product [Acidithrix sp. C25]
MRDVLSDLIRWRAQGKAVAIARVVGTEGSSPREPGATMAISDIGEVSGSVSGGCVEGAVVMEALAAMGVTSVAVGNNTVMDVDASGVQACPSVSVFGYSDDEAFAVGLTCGGTLRILIEPNVDRPYDLVARLLDENTPFVRATVVSGIGAVPGNDAPVELQISSEGLSAFEVFGALPSVGSTLIIVDGKAIYSNLENDTLSDVIIRDSQGALASGTTMVRHYGRNGQAKLEEVEVLFETFAPPPRMIIFGAVDFTAALARVGKLLGYSVSVCDARPIFATRVRFAMADEVVVDWPDKYLDRIGGSLGQRDAICVLTHDPKFDVPAIVGALKTKVGYIGAMGSRRTHQERSKRLIDVGVDPDELSRVMGPIGLDIGARTPEETAISIAGEIIALRTNKVPVSLALGEGPIHPRSR